MFAKLNFFAFIKPRVQSQFIVGPTKTKPSFNLTKHIFLAHSQPHTQLHYQTTT